MSINIIYTLSLHLFMLGSSLIYAFFLKQVLLQHLFARCFTVAIFCQLQSAYYVALRNYFKAIFYKYNFKKISKYFLPLYVYKMRTLNLHNKN